MKVAIRSIDELAAFATERERRIGTPIVVPMLRTRTLSEDSQRSLDALQLPPIYAHIVATLDLWNFNLGYFSFWPAPAINARDIVGALAERNMPSNVPEEWGLDPNCFIIVGAVESDPILLATGRGRYPADSVLTIDHDRGVSTSSVVCGDFLKLLLMAGNLYYAMDNLSDVGLEADIRSKYIALAGAAIGISHKHMPKWAEWLDIWT